MHNFINVMRNVKRFRTGLLGNFSEDEDVTFLTFSIDFTFNAVPMPTLGIFSSPLFIEEIVDYSAINYLGAIGMYPEHARLTEFKRLLKDITEKKPWYFQSIAGLDKLWANGSQVRFYKGKEAVLEIETLESLDLKMTYLADLYRKSVFDTTYMRELVPENLRKFEMDIYVSEFRNLRSITESLFESMVIQNKGVSNLLTRALDFLRSESGYFEKFATFLKFNCQFCEFDFSNSLPVDDHISVFNVKEPETNSFKIKVGSFLEQHQYRFFDILNKEKWSRHVNETRDDWYKAKSLNLDAVVRGAMSILNMGKNIYQEANGIYNSFSEGIGPRNMSGPSGTPRKR